MLVLVELQQAFDIVQHELLRGRMAGFGVQGACLQPHTHDMHLALSP